MNLKISQSEKQQILEMHKKAVKNNLWEQDAQSQPTEQEPNSSSTFDPDRLKKLPIEMTGVVNFYTNEAQKAKTENGNTDLFQLNLLPNAEVRLDNIDFALIRIEIDEGIYIDYYCKTNVLYYHGPDSEGKKSQFRIYNRNYQEDLKKNYCGVGINGEIVAPTTNPRYAMNSKNNGTGSSIA